MASSRLPYTLVSWCNPLAVKREEEAWDAMGGKSKDGKARLEFLAMYVDVMVDAVGGPDKAAELMAEQNKSPIDFAIQFCGGKEKCAERMGVSRQTLGEWLKRPVKDWRVGWLEKLSKASGIEEKTLKRVAPPAPEEMSRTSEDVIKPIPPKVEASKPEPRRKPKRGRKMT